MNAVPGSIFILSEDFPPNVGGVAQWAHGTANGLHAAGARVEIACRAFDGFGPHPRCAYPVRPLRHRHWRKWRTLYWRRAFSNRLARGPAPRLVIGSKWNATRGIVGPAKRAGVPVVTVVHGTDVTRPMSRLKRRVLRYTLANSARVVSVSRFTADWIVQSLDLDRERVAVVPNGVDPAAFVDHADHEELRSRLGLTDAPIVLTLSRVVARKGHDTVIRALSAIRAAVPGTQYVVAGPGSAGELARLRELAGREGVADAVTFLGYVESRDLPRLYGMCDVYAMPSRFETESGDSEGFGITFLEANACRKPVVGGRSGGVVDAIVDGVTGLLADPNDPTDVAQKIVELLNDCDRAQEMGEAGYRRVRDELNWSELARRLLDLLPAS